MPAHDLDDGQEPPAIPTIIDQVTWEATSADGGCADPVIR